MKGKNLRAAFRGAVLLASASHGAAAWSQAVPPGTPRVTIDENGVDLSAGSYNPSAVSISIGGARGLSWSPGRNDLSRTRMVPTGYSGNTITEMSVSIGDDATLFTNVNGSFVAKERDGYALSYDSSSSTYTYRTDAGDTATFSVVSQYSLPGMRDVLYVPRQIRYANGFTLGFQYSMGYWKTCPPNIPDYQCSQAIQWYKLTTISSRSGQTLAVRYKQDFINSSYRQHIRRLNG